MSKTKPRWTDMYVTLVSPAGNVHTDVDRHVATRMIERGWKIIDLPTEED